MINFCKKGYLKLHIFVKHFGTTLTNVMTKPRVVFVLGAPGSGKGTQCEKIVEVSCSITVYCSTV